MDQNTILTLLTISVAISALALLAGAISLVGMLLVARDLRGKFLQSWPDIQSVIASSKRSVATAEKQLGIIGASSISILDITKQQLVKVDELISDASFAR